MATRRSSSGEGRGKCQGCRGSRYSRHDRGSLADKYRYFPIGKRRISAAEVEDEWQMGSENREIE